MDARWRRGGRFQQQRRRRQRRLWKRAIASTAGFGGRHELGLYTHFKMRIYRPAKYDQPHNNHAVADFNRILLLIRDRLSAARAAPCADI